MKEVMRELESKSEQKYDYEQNIELVKGENHNEIHEKEVLNNQFVSASKELKSMQSEQKAPIQISESKQESQPRLS